MTTLTLGIAADPGLPLILSRRLRDRLSHALEARMGEGLEWDVQVEDLSMPIDDDGVVELSVNSRAVRKERGWDYVIYVTDLPKYVDGEPLVSSVNTRYGSAMVVLPTLGLVHPRRLGRVLVALADSLHTGKSPDPESTDDSLLRRTFSVDDDLEDEESHDAVETVKGFLGRVAMQAGMVRSNRPFRLVPKLSSAMAAASATGAFGIFYTSIWSMADYLRTPRLLAIGLLSLTVMTLWLIFSHGLLERPQGAKKRERRVTYNLATVLTILLAVAAMFVFLFAFILLGGLVVINVDYMSDQLGHPAGFPEYLNLAWLSASMGIIAGAVGSGLSDADAVRKATFSNREYLRRQITLDGPAGAAETAEAAAGAAVEDSAIADDAADSATQDAETSAQAAERADAAAQEAHRAKEAAADPASKEDDVSPRR